MSRASGNSARTGARADGTPKTTGGRPYTISKCCLEIIRYYNYFRHLLDVDPHKVSLTREEVNIAIPLARTIEDHMTKYANRQLWYFAGPIPGFKTEWNEYYHRLFEPELAFDYLRRDMEYLHLFPTP